ncbi:hypothetical protein [Rummeliibacillus suwonensis]
MVIARALAMEPHVSFLMNQLQR